MAVPEYPEHDKMHAPHRSPDRSEQCRLIDHSQLLGDFLEWLSDHGVVLAKWTTDEYGEDALISDHATIERRLADYFGIDLEAVEREKRAMLERVRGDGAELPTTDRAGRG